MVTKLGELPANLPVPVDDGAADHLEGALLPDVSLGSGDGLSVNLSQLKGRWVIYVYPMTGHPDVPLPQGWDSVPGARGCTPQSCSFRDYYAEFTTLNSGVFGLSAQSTQCQREARERLHLPFQLLSDDSLKLKRIFNLPTFCIAGMELYKRLTMIANDRTIQKVFYPVFPPDQNTDIVLAWMRKNV
jgi:peroxiredoxin